MFHSANPSLRRNQARKIREDAAKFAFDRPLAEHLNNQDETDFPGWIGSYSKGLPHNSLGEVDPKAYQALLNALSRREPAEIAAVPLGGQRRLSWPEAGLAFDLTGPDAQALPLPPAPRIDGPEVAAEMSELYWMALLRDVHFQDFVHKAPILEAARELSMLSAFRGPKEGGQVTPATLFRGGTPGDLAGPYVSQFLLQGAHTPTGENFQYLDQRQRTAVPGLDYLRDGMSWLQVQNGLDTRGRDQLEPVPRLIRNPRDLAAFVHFRPFPAAYLNACLILLAMNVPIKPGMPYSNVTSQNDVGPFGTSYLLGLIAEVTSRALKGIWFQKWFVHRRLRPEAYGGLVHHYLRGRASYPIHPELLNSRVVQKIAAANQTANHCWDRNQEATYLLPIAYPEGCPTHPAYGSAHAAVAGACVTVLKAWFDEASMIENPVVANAEGTGLKPDHGSDQESLTVGGELNKLAANLSLGCCMAGINWRSDCTRSLQFGEAIAIRILEEQKLTYPGSVCFTFTKLDGTTITL